MPKLRARTVERNRPLDLGEKLALSIGPGFLLPRAGSPAWRSLRSLWLQHGDPLQPPMSHRRPGHRCWAYWMFDRDVPDDLRPSDRDSDMTDGAAELARYDDDLQRRRLAWLRETGRLEEHELAELDRAG